MTNETATAARPEKRRRRWILPLALLFFATLLVFLVIIPNSAQREGALYLALDGYVVEQGSSPSPAELISGQLPGAEVRLRDIVHGLKVAAKDSKVTALVLDLDRFTGGGLASLSQIAAGISAVKKAGKPVFAYSSSYDDSAWFLAAHASEIWMDPMGQAALTGPGGSGPYFKGLLDRLGVNIHVYRVGSFKSAVEPFARDSQSPEAKKAEQALVDDIWGNWLEQAKRARPQAKLDAYIAKPADAFRANRGDLAKAAKALGLVDHLGDSIAFGKKVAEVAGRDEDGRADDYYATDFADYLKANPPRSSANKIGVITIAGEIVDGEAGSGLSGGDSHANLILDALAKDDLKALVVRIDSPGGSASASEKIRSAILAAKEKKLPVVISMGDVAASGGYWVAMTGDKIFAEPGTITGSIGVFAVLPTFESSLAKAGVKGDGVVTTPLSGQPDPLRGTNKETDEVIQLGVEDIYRRFLSLVSTARKMPVAKVDEVGQGRVWSGGAARQLGLVDAFGSLDDALAEAAKRAGLDPDAFEVKYLEQGQSFFASILSDLVGAEVVPPADLLTRMARRQQALFITGLSDAARIANGPAIQARCMACPPDALDMRRQSLLALLREEVAK